MPGRISLPHIDIAVFFYEILNMLITLRSSCHLFSSREHDTLMMACADKNIGDVHRLP